MDYDLLHFANPPLVEVALGVQFEPITGFLAPHMGLLWREYAQNFPNLAVKGALDPVVERFGVQVVEPPRLRISQGEAPPLRVWFQNAEGTELIQVQQDRFIHNWRRIGRSTEYPRYPRLVKKFVNEAKSLKRFLSSHELEAPRFNQCELIYINVLRPDRDPFDGHGDVGKIFAPFSLREVTAELGELDDAAAVLRFVLRESDGRPSGRVHVSLQPAYAGRERAESYRLEVSVRGEPSSEGLTGVRRFLDRAHEACVAAFKGVTTAGMHEAWGISPTSKEVV